MRGKWNTVPISELYDGLYDGPHATPKTSDSGPVFLGIKNVTDDGHLDMSDVRHIAEEDFARWTRRVEPKPGDIVFTYEATLNRYAIIPEGFRGCLGRRMALIRTDAKKVDAGFLFYYFFSPAWREVIKKNMMTGATVDRIPLITFPNFPVSVPPLPVQRRIAGILSAYDELMENSQRRIRLLEAMARALYREWFVHFRFPGHDNSAGVPNWTAESRPEGVSAMDGANQNHPRVASPLGDIPQGWAVRKLADFVTTKYGYTESTNIEPVGPKYLRGMDINKTSFIDWSEVPYCPISPEEKEAYRLRVGDVVVIRMADPGKVGIVEQEVDAVFASYLIRVAPKDTRLSPYFLFYLMESAEYYAFITGASTGTTRKSASAGVIAEYQFVLPPQELVEQFERRVSEIRSLLTTLLKKTVNLRRTRDLLLPRLLSGQIDMEKLEHA
jgi:type I restriction enzyme S subunit